MFHVLMNKQKQMSSCNPLRLFCYHLLLPLQVMCNICQKLMSSSNHLELPSLVTITGVKMMNANWLWRLYKSSKIVINLIQRVIIL